MEGAIDWMIFCSSAGSCGGDREGAARVCGADAIGVGCVVRMRWAAQSEQLPY